MENSGGICYGVGGLAGIKKGNFPREDVTDDYKEAVKIMISERRYHTDTYMGIYKSPWCEDVLGESTLYHFGFGVNPDLLEIRCADEFEKAKIESEKNGWGEEAKRIKVSAMGD